MHFCLFSQAAYQERTLIESRSPGMLLKPAGISTPKNFAPARDHICAFLLAPPHFSFLFAIFVFLLVFVSVRSTMAWSNRLIG